MMESAGEVNPLEVRSSGKSQTRFEQLIDFSPTIIYCAVPSGDFRITYISRNLVSILGYSPEETYADPDFWHDHIHPNDRPRVFTSLPQLFINDRHIVEYRFQHKHGHYLWIHDQLKLVRDKSGIPVDVVGSLTDITERKNAEKQSEEQKENLRSIISTALDAIITLDGAACIETINPAGLKIFGYEKHELIGEKVSQLIPASTTLLLENYLRDYFRNGHLPTVEIGPQEMIARRKNGSEFTVELAVSHIRNVNGDRFVGILRDITERKKTEHELIEYRDQLQDMVEQQTRDLVVARDEALAAERAMSTFLANMSHELRTPLHGILSFARFGIKKLDRVGLERLGEYFEEISDSGEHLLTLVNDLLDLSKLRSGKMDYDYRKADLDVLIREVKQEFSAMLEEHGIGLDYRCECPSREAMIDRTKIAQVIRNLFSNAIKFSPQNSTVTVLLTMDGGSRLQVEVSDRGVGIPEQELEYIFDAFSQSSKTRTNAGGTGLGLPICKEIIETGHQGVIKASNRAEGGACLQFCVPIGCQ